VLSGVLALGAGVPALAAAPKAAASATEGATEARAPRIKGTIKVEGRPSLEELKKKVKITQAEAEKAALKAVGAKEMKTTYSELELEQGYLVYSIDVKVIGKEGIEEIWVDAGNGKVLMRPHEVDDEEEDDEDEAGEDDPE